MENIGFISGDDLRENYVKVTREKKFLPPKENKKDLKKLEILRQRAQLYNLNFTATLPSTKSKNNRTSKSDVKIDKRQRDDILKLSEKESWKLLSTHLQDPMKHSIGRPPLSSVCHTTSDLFTTVPKNLDLTYSHPSWETSCGKRPDWTLGYGNKNVKIGPDVSSIDVNDSKNTEKNEIWEESFRVEPSKSYDNKNIPSAWSRKCRKSIDKKTKTVYVNGNKVSQRDKLDDSHVERRERYLRFHLPKATSDFSTRHNTFYHEKSSENEWVTGKSDESVKKNDFESETGPFNTDEENQSIYALNVQEKFFERKLERKKHKYHDYLKMPVGNDDFIRSYRLGLDSFPSLKTMSSSYSMSDISTEFNSMNKNENNKIINSSMHLTRLNSLSNIHTVDNKLIKVSGALRRPKTANISFLKSITVVTSNNPVNLEKICNEEIKMKQEQDKRILSFHSATKRLQENTDFASLSIPFIFGCLKYHALENLSILYKEKYATIGFEEYTKIQNKIIRQDNQENIIRDNYIDDTILWVSRSQFLLVFLSYKIPFKILNRAYSSFDINVIDRLSVHHFCEVFTEIRNEQKKSYFI